MNTANLSSHKQNLHTHSTYCDGKDTPEEMIRAAMARGFSSLGFSMHSPTGRTAIITADKLEAYRTEVLRLQEKYRGIFGVFLGIEYDFHSLCGAEGFEYTIASVHALLTEEGVRGFDTDLDATREYIRRYFAGDALRFSRTYYETLAEFPRLGNFDILGHVDLVTKNNELGRFFDTSSPEYLDHALEAVHALAGKIPLFEVNTGAVARGYRTAPYPQPEILREMRQLGYGAVITSDCHDSRFIDCCFDEAAELLRANGFRSRFILTENGFAETAL